MSITLTQSNGGFGTTSPVATAFQASVTAGDLLVIAANDTNAATATLGISDSLGNTYSQVSTFADQYTGRSSIWCAVTNASGPNTVTVTSTGSKPFLGVYIHEFASSTGWQASPVDASVYAFGATAAVSSGSITTAAAGELIFGFITDGITPGPGFTIAPNTSSHVEYLTQASAGAIAATGTQSNNFYYGACVAAFKPNASAPPSSYFRTITLDHTQVSAAQANFPVLLRFADPTLKSVANGGHVQNASGFDLLLTADQAGSQLLAWEVEKYDPVAGSLVLWVNVPALSSTADTVLYLQYGNASIATDQSNKTGAWNSNFAGVWHLSNPANLGADSTANANNGANYGATSSSDASIGSACAAFAAANSQHIYVADAPSLKPTAQMTMAGWINPQNQTVSYSNAFGKLPVGGSAAAYGFWLFETSTQIQADINEASVYASFNLAIGQWSHLAMTYDGATIGFYINGVLNGSQAHTGAIVADTAPFTMGANTDASLCFNGSLAEIQLASAAYSAAWVAAAALTQQHNASALLSNVPGAGNWSSLHILGKLALNHV